jgi:hypothetical protein
MLPMNWYLYVTTTAACSHVGSGVSFCLVKWSPSIPCLHVPSPGARHAFLCTRLLAPSCQIAIGSPKSFSARSTTQHASLFLFARRVICSSHHHHASASFLLTSHSSRTVSFCSRQPLIPLPRCFGCGLFLLRSVRAITGLRPHRVRELRRRRRGWSRLVFVNDGLMSSCPQVDGKHVELALWDTAGQEVRHTSLMQLGLFA